MMSYDGQGRYEIMNRWSASEYVNYTASLTVQMKYFLYKIQLTTLNIWTNKI